jgi:hypothetical protein
MLPRLAILFLIAPACWPQDALLVRNATLIDASSMRRLRMHSVLIRQMRVVSLTRGVVIDGAEGWKVIS